MSDDTELVEWDDDDYVTVCDQCGQLGRCQQLPDPFLDEVYPEDTHEVEWWCRRCWQERKEEA